VRNAVGMIVTCFLQSIVLWQIPDSKSDRHPELTKLVICQISDFFIESFGIMIKRICKENKLRIHAIFQRAVKERRQNGQLASARRARKEKQDTRVRLMEGGCRLEK
jgi:hypothetical protein